MPFVRSELILDPQLDDTSIVRAGDDAEGGGADRAARLAEADVVEQVEGLDPELDQRAAGQVEVLEQRRIGAREAGPANDVAALVADLAGVGSQGQALEAAGVEPLRH